MKKSLWNRLDDALSGANGLCLQFCATVVLSAVAVAGAVGAYHVLRLLSLLGPVHCG